MKIKYEKTKQLENLYSEITNENVTKINFRRVGGWLLLI